MNGIVYVDLAFSPDGPAEVVTAVRLRRGRPVGMGCGATRQEALSMLRAFEDLAAWSPPPWGISPGGAFGRDE